MSDAIFANVQDRPFAERAAVHSRLIEPIAAHRRYVERANRAAARAGLIFIPQVEIRTAVTLARWQTAFRDQQGRGSCYAFAAIAALEAAYHRKHGVVLDLSEQYAFHINKASELIANYTTRENNTSLNGFEGASGIVEKMARFAVPAESDCPYLSEDQMQALKAATPAAGTLSTQEEIDAFEYLEAHIPTAARRACRYRVKSFQALPGNPTPSDVMAVISAGYEVVADIPGHCFLIIGYDLARRQFIIKNSWNENAFITRGFDEPILGGHYITDVHPPDAPPQKEAMWMGRWNMDHDGWRGTLVIRRWTDYRNGDGQPTKLGSYYRDGSRYDVNGVTTDGGQNMQMWIANTTTRVAPGSQSGHLHNAFVFSWEPTRAAGLHSSNGTDFGTQLRRSAVPAMPRMNGFDENEWIGEWAMSHDGWNGRLQIAGIRPLRGRYHAQNGAVHEVGGGLDGHPHILNLTVTFAPGNVQRFRLAHHTWEKQLFSGTTTSAGHGYGVTGERQDRHAVYGAIRAKWVALGAFFGFLGHPGTGESATPDGRGRFNHFEGGSIYWTPQTGAFEVHGSIRDKWAATGWERGFGYPLTDETTTPDGRGRYNHFERGSIYWTPQTGAHVIYGAIRDHWASMGWERSRLGYPTSDEKDWPGVAGGRCSDFEHGRIVWSPGGVAREG